VGPIDAGMTVTLTGRFPSLGSAPTASIDGRQCLATRRISGPFPPG